MRTVLCCSFALLIAACDVGDTDDTEMAAERAAAEQAVVTFFESLGDSDIEPLHAAVTSDFELVQDTMVLDWAAFVEYVTPFMDAGATVVYEFSDFNTKVRGPVAWTRYRSRSVFRVNGQTTRSEWLESAVLVHRDDGWKIDRLQSTPLWIQTEGI